MVAPVPPDISYGLECSVECFDITHDVLTYYYRFNNEPLAKMVDDSNYRAPDLHENLRSLSRLYYRPYNRWFWQEACPLQQAWCLSQAVDGFGRRSAELIDYVFRQFTSDTLANGYDPARRSVQQIWLDKSRQVSHVEKTTAQLAKKINHVDGDLLREAILQPGAFIDRLGFPIYDHEANLYRTPNPKPLSVADLNKIKQKKITVLKRSSAFLSKLIGTKNVSLFVGGKEIRVTGDKYTFSLIKKSIQASDHGALAIAVYDNKTQERLFDLCWYIENTPALDQISALVMAVRAGDEDEIIRVGNAFNVKRDTLERHQHLHDFTVDPRFDGTSQVLNNLDRMDQFALDDRLFHHHPGTAAYIQNHGDAYIQFASLCTKRLTKQRIPSAIAHYYRPHPPHLLRTIVDGRVARDLLPEPPRLLAA